MNDLTKRQKEILDFIKKFLASKGYPPTVREIGSALELSSPATTHVHLHNLEDKGFIKLEKSKNRAIELLVDNEYQNTDDQTIQVPLLGKITAGNPIEAIENPDEFFALPYSFIPKNKEVFTLHVSGDSMINAGIFDGDIVIIEKSNTANNGEIIVAMTDENEVTLKTFYKEKDHIRLQPENDNMEPFIFSNITILGKAIGLYRKI